MAVQDRDRYLDDVTSGLRDDPELRLDVRAELAAHVEDKREELAEKGVSPDESDAQALRSLGDVTEVSTALAAGNRRRLWRRAWVRRVLRFGLVPLAVMVALLCSDFQFVAVFELMHQLGGPNISAPWLESLLKVSDAPVLRLSPRELWESDRDNRAYYGHFVTHEVARRISTLRTSPPSGLGVSTEALLADLVPAREIDPGNARYDYLRAAALLKVSAKIDGVSDGDASSDAPAIPWTWSIEDREELDRAMAFFKSGLSKERYRRYGLEVLDEKLQALGPPGRFLEQLRFVAMAASVLLPDLGQNRSLCRASVLYAELLIDEGRAEEAVPYLEAWETMVLHLNSDSWCLIDQLVVTALASAMPEYVATLYERMGRPEDAARVRHNGELLAGPGKRWKEQRERHQAQSAEDSRGQRDLERYAGTLTRMLLPALGTYPEEDAYEASRRLEYVVMMEALLTVISAILMLAMVVCLVIALRWRFSAQGAAIPILLLPSAWRACGVLGLGVLLPMATYGAVVAFVPISGHAYSLQAGDHKLVVEVLLLSAAILLAPTLLVTRYARKRCGDLDIGVPRQSPWRVLVPLAAGIAIAVAVWLVPASIDRRMVSLSLFPCGLAAGLLLVLFGVVIRFLFGSADYGLYYGTVARSLIPTYAAAVILLCGIGRPILLRAERYLLRHDQILGAYEETNGQMHAVGFTKIETRMVNDLKQGVNAAAENLRH